MWGTNGISQFTAALHSLGQSGSAGPDAWLSVVGAVQHPAVLVVHSCLRYRDMDKTQM